MAKERLNRSIEIKKIKPNDYNPNEMTRKEFNECKREIKHLNKLPKPVIVRPIDGEFVIVDGEHNWRAAKELGFTEVPCEIIQVDDAEAMRQTYKRNRHGTFNRIKLGKMFERVMKETDWSLRKTAKEYDISDGTIRNAFLYLKAKELRNSYAFEDLTIRQIRIYLDLAPVIRDKWLDAGAGIRTLFSKGEIDFSEHLLGRKLTESTFEEAERNYKNYHSFQKDLDILDRLKAIHKTGLSDKIKATPEGFQKTIKEIEDFCSWEHWKVAYGPLPRPMTGKMLRKYTIHYYGVPSFMRSNFVELFKLIYFEGKFQITPEEFETILKDSKKFGCEPGYAYQNPQYKYMKDALQVLLIEKGVLNEPVDIESLPNPAEELARLKFEKTAPDYLKSSALSTDIKIGILEYKPNDIDNDLLEKLKKNFVETCGERKWADLKDILKELDELIAVNQVNKEYESKTEEDLTLSIIKFSNLYKKEGEQKKLDSFKSKLLRLTKKELHRIEDMMGYTDWTKSLRSAIGSREAKRDDYWLKMIMESED